jgi:hypothetical protein
MIKTQISFIDCFDTFDLNCFSAVCTSEQCVNFIVYVISSSYAENEDEIAMN